MSVVTLVAGGQLLPRFVIFGAAAVLTPWYVLVRVVAEGGRQRAEARDRVIVVGDGEEGDLAPDRARRRPGTAGGRRRRVRHRVDDRCGHGLPLVVAR